MEKFYHISEFTSKGGKSISNIATRFGMKLFVGNKASFSKAAKSGKLLLDKDSKFIVAITGEAIEADTIDFGA